MKEPKEEIVIVGAGEFAEIAYEYFTYDSPYEVVAFSVEKDYLKKEELFGLPVVPFEELENLYDLVESRGGHAHKRLQQFIIAASGSFDVSLDDGFERNRFHLNRSYYGLYVPQMIWRELDDFSSGSVCLVMASEVYDEDDYIRDYETFKEYVKRGDGK